MSKLSRKRSKSIQFSQPIVAGPSSVTGKESSRPRSILKSPNKPKRSGRRKKVNIAVEESSIGIKRISSKKSPSRVKVQYSPFEQIIIQGAKQITKNKRMSHATIMEKWNRSSLACPSIEEIGEKEIQEAYKTRALDPDQKFNVDLSELRRVYPASSEEQIRCVAFRLDQNLCSLFT